MEEAFVDFIEASITWQGPLPQEKYPTSHEGHALGWAARQMKSVFDKQTRPPVALCQSAMDGLAAGQSLCRRCHGGGTIMDYASSAYGDSDPRICTCGWCDGTGLIGARAIIEDHAMHIITGITTRYFEGLR